MQTKRGNTQRLLWACGAFALACGGAPVEDVADTSAAIELGDAGPACDGAAQAPERVDPSAFASPEEALEAYARSREAACTVQLTRRGKPLTIEYSIR
jgi:hypothetical protein